MRDCKLIVTVRDELTRALIEETTLEDISESYRPVVDIIGIEKFPDKGFSNNPAKTVWKPDMTNISPELRKMFRERKQPEDGETK